MYKQQNISVPWPWRPLNDCLGPIRGSTLSVIIGRMKTTKTFRLIQVASRPMDHGATVWFVSLEMNREAVHRRFIATEMGLDYSTYRDNPTKEAALYDLAEPPVGVLNANPLRGDLLEIYPQGERMTALYLRQCLEGLGERPEGSRPIILLVDAGYKLWVDGTTGELGGALVLRALQVLAADTGVPIVTTMQAGRTHNPGVRKPQEIADTLVALHHGADAPDRTVYHGYARGVGIPVVKFSTGSKPCHQFGPQVDDRGVEDWSVPREFLVNEQEPQ